MLQTCPMDEDGFFNFSVTNLWHRAIVETARLVIVEVNERLPYVFGEQDGVTEARSTTSSRATVSLRRNCRTRRHPRLTVPLAV